MCEWLKQVSDGASSDQGVGKQLLQLQQWKGGREEGGRKGFRLQFLCVCTYKFLFMFAVDQLALAVKQVTVSHSEERNGERIVLQVCIILYTKC